MQLSKPREEPAPEPDAVLMRRRNLVYVYYPGDFADALSDGDLYETEFLRGLDGTSQYFQLVVQLLFADTGEVAYREILKRGGKARDTAPYQRMTKMTLKESATLLETTLRQYKEEERCTVNIIHPDHLQLCCAHKRIVVEITQGIIEQTTPENVQQAKGKNPLLKVWADDVPFNSESAMRNLDLLLPYLDGIKIATMDLAKAYEEPLVKNPIDAPGDLYKPPHDSELKSEIDEFLIMLSEKYPNMVITLELNIPRAKLPRQIDGMTILTQGGAHGARAFRIAEFDPKTMVQKTYYPLLETYALRDQ